MPGVRLLGYLKTMMETRGSQRRAALSPPGLASLPRAALRTTFSGASREVRRSGLGSLPKMRIVSTAHPNNGMHPTANSVAFNLNHPARRVMPGVRPLSGVTRN
jgi:hypothetical protein